jgi:hypothetical protein
MSQRFIEDTEDIATGTESIGAPLQHYWFRWYRTCLGMFSKSITIISILTNFSLANAVNSSLYISPGIAHLVSIMYAIRTKGQTC